MPTTSQVNPEQYEAMFEPILKEGKDIIHKMCIRDRAMVLALGSVSPLHPEKAAR